MHPTGGWPGRSPGFPFPGAGGETLEIAFGAIKLNSRLHFLVSLLYSGRQIFKDDHSFASDTRILFGER